MPAATSALAPAAFVGLDVAASNLFPPNPVRIVSPVFALNYGGADAATLPALAGLDVAATHLFPPNPVRITSPVFFGLYGLELPDGMADALGT